MHIKSLLKIELPIIQAPMAGVQDQRLAIAVTNAGGLGSIPCAMLSHTQITEQIEQFKAQSDGSYNLNFFCNQTPADNPEALQRWRQQLAPYYAEFDIQPSNSAGPSRNPIDQQIVELLAPFKPPVISFHFGLPNRAILQQIKAWGTVVLSSATSVAEALWLEQHGADVIIAQGAEAGGHRAMFLETDLGAQQGTFSLLPNILNAVSVPVIAAGGIADANGVRAAISLGASAVQIGTSYLLCDEATTSTLHRQALLSPSGKHTCITNVFSGRPARGIINRAITELGPISEIAPQFPLASAAFAPLRSAAEQQQIGDFSHFWCGQNNSGCQAISAAQMTKQLSAGLTGVSTNAH
ncbi:MAG: nitronate monooxygenase [Pseudomonadales bacterium]|nr:nitronate monooxygenase [Pseudomonadales bacterium]